MCLAGDTWTGASEPPAPHSAPIKGLDVPQIAESLLGGLPPSKLSKTGYLCCFHLSERAIIYTPHSRRMP